MESTILESRPVLSRNALIITKCTFVHVEEKWSRLSHNLRLAQKILAIWLLISNIHAADNTFTFVWRDKRFVWRSSRLLFGRIKIPSQLQQF